MKIGTITFIILGLVLVSQLLVWPLPLYYWLAGECTRGILSFQGQNLLKLKARGSWQSSEAKRWQVITSDEVFEYGKKREDDFLIVVFTPWELNGLSYNERVQYIKKATEKVIAIGADLICDASAADRARQTEKDHATTRLLKRAGIARAVIFDGGHHLPNLALEPELLLCPVIGGSGGQELVAHGFCRDALPFENLLKIKKLLSLNSAVVTFPRLAGYLKSPKAMGTLCWQSVKLLASSKPQEPQKMSKPVVWGPRFSLFACGVLLWRPDSHDLLYLSEAMADIQKQAKLTVKKAFLALDGESQLPSGSEQWELATVGLSSWQIMLGKINR